jgi:hypothetical protein
MSLHIMAGQGHAKRRATQLADQPVKRTRVSRACDQCRIAREKCDGIQPICSTCIKSRRACTYTANVKKRGIQPGYIRALELALAFLFQHDPENESLVNGKLSQGEPASLLLSRGSKESNRLHKRWRKAQFYTNLDICLSGGESLNTGLSEPQSPVGDNEVSDDDASVTAAITDQQQNQGYEKLPHYTRPEEKIPESLQQQVTSDTWVILPLDNWRLIEMYFTYIHSWYPVCEKHDILKLSYSYPTEGARSSLDPSDSGSYAELWSILAVASIYNPDDTRTSTQPSMTSRQLYATTKSFIPDESGQFSLAHVRALLNLAIFNMTDRIAAAWLLVGCASRIAQALDQQTMGGESRRKHTFRGCFVLESLLAIHFGSRPYFTVDDLHRFAEVDENGLEEWQPWVGGSSSLATQQPRTPLLALSSFNALADIVGIFANAKQISTDKALQKFNSWKRSLPYKLDYVVSESTATPLTPPAVLLQLLYYCTALTITCSRAWILRSMVLLERVRDQMDLRSRPPALRCLMEIINKGIAQCVVERLMDPTLQRRSLGVLADINEAWSITSNDFQLDVQHPLTPQLVQPANMLNSLSTTHALEDSTITGDKQGVLPLFDHCLPTVHPATIHDEPGSSQHEFHTAVPMETRYPGNPHDQNNLFDELASLDQSATADSQPLFMQNLGFPLDANMASLFDQYMPQSSTIASQEDFSTLDLGPYGFLDVL